MSDYEVGYKKPPVHTQFQKGVCPNRKGRPKKTADLALDIIRTLVNEPMRYPIRGKMRLIPRIEGLIRNHGTKAIKGNVKDADAIINIIERSEKFGDIIPQAVILSSEDMKA